MLGDDVPGDVPSLAVELAAAFSCESMSDLAHLFVTPEDAADGWRWLQGNMEATAGSPEWASVALCEDQFVEFALGVVKWAKGHVGVAAVPLFWDAVAAPRVQVRVRSGHVQAACSSGGVPLLAGS